MTLRSNLLQFIAGLVFERPVRRLTTDQIRQRLTTGGDTVVTAMRATRDTDAHQRVATHIIGIERWGQARIRELLTGTHIVEEYDHYRPANASMAQLAETMVHTRAETLALLDQLSTAGITLTQQVPHNMFGQMTLAGWLQYLNAHATLESRKLGK